MRSGGAVRRINFRFSLYRARKHPNIVGILTRQHFQGHFSGPQIISFPLRPIAFVLAASNHGSMIVNRNDRHVDDRSRPYGVGFQIFDKSGFEENEVSLMLALLDCRHKHFGSGVVAVDGGANIGVHTIEEWARHMYGWGRVLGFEAQEVLYYALAGNVALNNCMNARSQACCARRAVR